MAESPLLSILIVNWNTRELLAQCLRSIYATADDLALEVVVVDNASSDGSVAMIRQHFPQVRLIANDANLGFARANNQAIAVSQGRYLLLLNSDTEVKPGALQALVAFMDAHPEAGAVGGRLRFPDGRVQGSHGRLPTLLSEIVNTLGFVAWRSTSPADAEAAPDDRQAVETEWLLGACLMVRREVVEQVGGLDEQFFIYSEEIDWCRRIREAGWRVFYLPQAEVIHYWRGSTRQRQAAMKAELYRSKLQYFRKHDGPWAALALRGAVLITSLGKSALYGLLALVQRHRRLQARMWWTVARRMLRPA